MNNLSTFFIIILLLPLGLLAQNNNGAQAITLQYGMNHEDHISELGEIDYYTFTGNEGDVIMLRMRDETKVDSYMKLYDPDGDMVKSAWSDGGLAKIRNLKLEKTGTYELHAYDRNHNDVGKYGISLHKLNINEYATPIPEVISFEDDIEQIVGVNTYSFQAKKGDVLFTQMRAQTVHLECEFYIYNSEGEEVYKAVNSGRLATVGPVQLEKSDTYTIVVTDRGGNDKDKFGMTHMLLNKHETVPNLVCGDNKTDHLGKLVQRNAFRLKTKAGQRPMVEARSNNTVLETTMMIFDEKGGIIRQKSSTNKLITEILPASDEEKSYLVVVYDRNGNDFGDFGIQVQFLDDSFCPSVLTCDSEEETIVLDGLAQSKLFSIEGRQGDPIHVVMKETESYLEPHLRMYNMDGEMVAESYDGVKAKLSDQFFPADGKYLILASDRSGNDLGAFKLTTPESSDLLLEMTECQTVYRGYTEQLSTVEIQVEASGNDLEYLWSNGATEKKITVSPLESTNYTVTVTNGVGCSSTASTFVEVEDVSCGNGNGAPKVEVCHVKNNGQHQTLCISINGVDEHLFNGIGHEGCHIGPCGYGSACDDEEGKTDNIGTNQRSFENKEIIYPNPTSSTLHINLENIVSEEVYVSLFNVNGQKVMSETLENRGQVATYHLDQVAINQGVYFLSVRSKEFNTTQQIIFIK